MDLHPECGAIMYSLFKRFCALVAFAFFICHSATASVVMTGSRIIYPSDAKSVDVQLRNNDDFPYIVQAWFDSGNDKSTPTTHDSSPFMVMPPTFRIAAKEGQVLRVFYTGTKPLPQDRESVFYFNFLQIPPGNIGEEKGSQMVVMLKNRLKIFYRPVGLKQNNKKIFDYLKFSNITSGNIRISNTSPYYVSLAKITVNGAESKDKAPMIAPFTYMDVALKTGKLASAKPGISIGLINDYGAMVTNEYSTH